MKDWKFHCAVLGVKENASAKEVRRAYRKLALERHPDKHNNSNHAKEEFQQLNESYRHLLDGLADGMRHKPAAPVEREDPTKPDFQPPAQFRSRAPARRAAPKKRSTVLTVWLPSVAAACVILGATVWVELRRDAGTGPVNPNAKAWCLIEKPGETGAFEQLPEANCKADCAAVAATRDVNCSWGGQEFRTAKTPPPPPAHDPLATLDDKAKEEVAQACDVTIDRSGAEPATSSYRAPSANCRVICGQKATDNPRAGVKCLWNGEMLYEQAKFVPKEDRNDASLDRARVPTEPAPVTAANGEVRASCYMTIVVPGDFKSEVTPPEPEKACMDRCTRAVLDHPDDWQVECSFNGRQIVKHVPDPLLAYLKRNPAHQAHAPDMGVCEVYGTLDDRRVQVYTGLGTSTECGGRCVGEIRRAAKGTLISCNYGGQEILKKVVE